MLRALVRGFEAGDDQSLVSSESSPLRTKLHLAPEPAIDPERVDIEQLHLSRLPLVPVERLDDDRLLALYHRSRTWGEPSVMNQAARVIDQRPSLLSKGQISALHLYGDLAVEAASKHDRALAADLIARGRGLDSPIAGPANAIAWEMVEFQIAMMLEEPEVWVPRLAVIMERHRTNRDAISAVLLRLVSLGLVQAMVDPKRPGQLMLDTTILQTYMSEYGPRITTATGELGAAAAQGGIWTPDSAAAPSPVWTPGSASPVPRLKETPKLILPGQ